QVSCRHPAILRLNFYAYAVPACSHGGDHCGAGAAKRIKYRVTYKREHPDKSGGQFQREWRRVMPRRCPGNVPDLLKPSVKFILRYSASFALGTRWLSVSSRLALH